MLKTLQLPAAVCVIVIGSLAAGAGAESSECSLVPTEFHTLAAYCQQLWTPALLTEEESSFGRNTPVKRPEFRQTPPPPADHLLLQL